MSKQHPINRVIFHIAQIASVVLAFVFFGWQGLVLVLLLTWQINIASHGEV